MPTADESQNPDLTILFNSCPNGIRPDAIDIQWNSQPVILSTQAAAHLDSRWNFYLADAQSQGKSLFNGPITRLIDVQCQGSGLSLHLGPADYKTFVVTRLRDRAWFEAHFPQAMARALGSSVLLTHRDEALLGIRSERVSAYPDRAHLLGGVLDLLGTEQFSADVQGLIAHLVMELQEEAGIGLSNLEPVGEWPRLLGIVQDEFLAQPEAVWRWETKSSPEALASRLDPHEHAGWMKVRRGSVDEATWIRMTPVARHAWHCWAGSK